MTDAPEHSLSLRRAGDDFRWPDGKHIAVVFNIGYDGWSEDQAPSPGQMANPLPPGTFDTNAHSWASYGVVRGLSRLLDAADRNGIRTSVMVSAVLAERDSASVRGIHERGHEIVAHSYAQDVMPVFFETAADERANIDRTTRLLEQAAGVRPSGWISPRATASRRTPRLLVEAGYLWHGDYSDDDTPYVIDVDGTALVAIPLNMDVNDMPHALRYGRTAPAFVDAFTDNLEALRAETRAGLLDVTAHTYVYGRPAGARAWEAIMQKACAATDLWLATREEIARFVTGEGASYFAPADR